MKSALMALSATLFLIGCGQTESRPFKAIEGQAEIEAGRVLPDFPPRCRALIFSDVRPGDRLDVALLKTDAALARQHSQTRICAAWYDELKAGLSEENPPN